jgi:hypothetical protein
MSNFTYIFSSFEEFIIVLMDGGIRSFNAVLACCFPVALLLAKLAMDFIPAKCCKKVECAAEPISE